MLRIDFTGAVGVVTCSKESDLAFTTGMVGKTVLVRFNEEWTGLEVLISFWNDVTKMPIEIGTAPVDQYLEVEVPWEILLDENKPIKIGAYGYTLSGEYIVTAIPTIWELLGYVRRGSDGNGSETAPDPTVHIGSDDVVAIANGGTAARTALDARRKLGITFENLINESTGVLPVNRGGTGGANTTDALLSLGAWDLNGGNEIPAGSDLDEYMDLGTYYCTRDNRDSIVNTPFESDPDEVTAGFKMMVNRFITGSARFQLLFASKNNPVIYIRAHGDGAWQPWIKLLSTKSAVSVEQGGTGATTSAQARNNLGITFENLIGESSGVLPVNKGGTGSNTAASARAELGVPSYAAMWPSQATMQLLKRADGSGDLYPVIGTHLITTSDKEPPASDSPLTPNNIVHSGFYYINPSSPKTGLPKDPDYADDAQAGYGVLLHICYGSAAGQIFFDISHNRFYFRTSGGTWSSWHKPTTTVINTNRT